MSKNNRLSSLSRDSKPSSAIIHPLLSSSPTNISASGSKHSSLDSRDFNVASNPFWIHFAASDTLKETRDIFTQNTSTVLVLPSLSACFLENISPDEIEAEIDNYILYTNLPYTSNNASPVKFSTSSGLFGTVNNSKLSVDGVFPDEKTMNNLIQEQEHSFDSPLSEDSPEPSTKNSNVKSLFDVLVNNIDKKSFSILHSDTAQLSDDYNSFVKIIFLNERINSSHFSLNTCNPQERRKSSHILMRSNSFISSTTSKSASTNIKVDTSHPLLRSTSNNILSSLDYSHKNDLFESLKFRKINRLKQELLASLSSFTLHLSITPGQIVECQIIEKSLENIAEFSDKISSDLLDLFEDLVQSDSESPSKKTNFSFSIPFITPRSNDSKKTALNQLSKLWNYQITKLTENFYSIIFEFIKCEGDNDTIIQEITTNAVLSIEQLLFEWSHSSIFRAVSVFFDGEKNDETISSQIASLSLLDVKIHHLGLHDTNTSFTNHNLAEFTITKNNDSNSLDFTISKIASELNMLSKTKNLHKMITYIHNAVSYAASTKIFSTDAIKCLSDGNIKEHQKETNSTQMTADILLPILIYSLIKSNPSKIYSSLILLQFFHSKSLLSSLESYSLVTLQAATEYLLSVDVEKLMNSYDTTCETPDSSPERILSLNAHQNISNLKIIPIESIKDDKNYSNILNGFSEIPSMISKVPIVSAVGNLGYGIVSGAAGSGIRAATGILDAIKNVKGKQALPEKELNSKTTPQLAQKKDINDLNQEIKNLHIVNSQSLESKTRDNNNNSTSEKLKFAPINAEFINLGIDELKYNQIEALLESYKELANFVIHNI
ncbi:hypothetical protein BB561_001261 [Smittium simulii]|uniref:VPS9 domain-containing protein n=1 Tax=Smittium simulii TaxID=133385 RepID=A0A2T9YVF0_9FUNG|nr:hypothetical protein BB561_001261 [Smittium simulii]